MPISNSYNRIFINILSFLTTLIDKQLASLSRKKQKTFLNKKYESSLFVTNKSVLNNNTSQINKFLSGPTLVLKSVGKALNSISKNVYIEDWSSRDINFKFFNNIKNLKKENTLICGLTCPKLFLAKLLNPECDLILILMNANNGYRLEQIKKNINQYKIEVIKEEIPSPPFLQSLLLFLADKVILIGNEHTLSSYLNKGWKKSLFEIANAQIDSNFFYLNLNKNRYENKLIYCFPASMHGHRKGLFYSIDSWIKFFRKIKSLNRDLPTLIMTGNFPELYDNYLKKKYGESYKNIFNIENRGWVLSDDLKSIYLKSKFIIAAPLEEGQVAAVLEAVAFGITPIISKDTGISFTNYDYVNSFDNGIHQSLYEALLNTYLIGAYGDGDGLLKDKKRKKFIDYYSKRSVYNSFLSVFR